ncbi:hypothetical protein [Burkholderia ubonensis]|uniref:hypothetical protein n=1 Tax=Burkholderia ubonensis TaxID=101571 RepID=UPI000AE8D069|nr:hypothetical protein [Burkholderia ubonensis]
MGYYTPRRHVTFNGQPVLSLFDYGFGVVLEGTPAYGLLLVRDSQAHSWASNYDMPGHEFIEVGCIK